MYQKINNQTSFYRRTNNHVKKKEIKAFLALSKPFLTCQEQLAQFPTFTFLQNAPLEMEKLRALVYRVACRT